LKSKRIIGIVLFVLGILFEFSELISYFPKWLSIIGLPIVVLGNYLFWFSFNWKKPYANSQKRVLRKSCKNSQNKVLPEISENKKLDLLHFVGLDDYKEMLISVFFSEDKQERIIIYKYKDKYVRYCKEHLYLFDDEDIFWSGDYGYWCCVSSTISIFEDEILVLNDLKNELKGFNEEKIDFDSII